MDASHLVNDPRKVASILHMYHLQYRDAYVQISFNSPASNLNSAMRANSAMVQVGFFYDWFGWLPGLRIV
jgi:hypothetical protein